MSIEIPSNVDIEQQIIGAILKDPKHSNCRETIDSLSADDFYSHGHKVIFNAIKLLSENKKDIDPSLVESALEGCEINYGGWIYLVSLVKDTFGTSNLSSYVLVVKKSSMLRGLYNSITKATGMISENITASEIIATLEDEFKSLTLSSNGCELRHIETIEDGWLDRLQERADRGGAISGLCTGIDQLDERINGIGDESLVVVAGAPSMGKTLLCQSIAANIGVDQKKNIMFFSMEMSEIEMFERFVSGVGNVPAAKLRNARLDNGDYGKISNTVKLLRDSGIYITDQPSQSLGQIRAKARRHKSLHPDLSAIFIDYLGLMKLGRADRHDIAIGDITRGLKELAKEIKVPVILCAQANRGLYNSKRPNMSNLKDSSCIEADADLIVFVHRQEIIDPETELKGMTELIIAKDRHGDGNGTVFLEKVNGRFSSLTAEAAGRLQQAEESRLNPPKSEKRTSFK